ncbi:oxidoreductase [Wenjunlia vitaminophila]|uniref:Oxidoreductase n=1 Tax=Wenjunlia vitaminophila TaxID=76728 RepID=A0A0T6LXT6_WENVI|nr:CBS domain-containing protein [Wenjunlia vitaminophila]KRV50556.1 oxidoreductase [Wenjunlia vitaminophila]
MAQQVRDVMTGAPVTIESLASVTEVARRMRDEDIGAILVVEGEQLQGLVTDRDLVVRCLAEGRDPDQTTVYSVCSGPVVTVQPEDDAAAAVQLMRSNALRRLPVTQDGHTVGVVSIGDLAIERDERSALADISAAPPNR